MMDVAPIIPTAALEKAHTIVDQLVAELRRDPTRQADTQWLHCLQLVSTQQPEQRQQNLALLLTVALQRLARA